MMVPIFVLLLCIALVASSAFALSSKPQLMLASSANLHALTDKPNAYFVSEKLDGMRAYWSGTKLISRSGKLIAAPKWFIEALPTVAIEGELWLDRGKFEKLISITSKQAPIDKEWQQVKFMLFDLPASDKHFEQRLHDLSRLIEEINKPFIQLIPHFSFNNVYEIESYLKNTLSHGGEGIMLHLANSTYQPGRQKAILKVKPYYDAEATVIDHVAGAGKFKGVMGALLVKNKQGKTFKIGTGFSLSERRDPPKFGQLITYKYYGLTSTGKPKFASFLRVRNND